MGGHPINATKALPGKDMISDGLLGFLAGVVLLILFAEANESETGAWYGGTNFVEADA
jgi:hypothetical protein